MYMSIYPPPQTHSNVFNDSNYDASPSYSTNVDIDLSNYVQKTGSTMTGTLKVPMIQFNDGSTQSTAHNQAQLDSIAQSQTQIESDLSLNTYKLTNTTFDDTYTDISGLKINGTISKAFTGTDKIQLYANTGATITNASSIDINTSNISINATNINTNITNIAQNTSNIAQNTNNIDQNTYKLEPFNHAPDRVTVNKPLFFGNVGYIATYGDVLRIDSNQSTPIALNPGANNDIVLYANAVTIGRENNSNGRIQMNNEIQNHCFTDTDHGHVNSIPALSTSVNDHTNQITQIDATLTQLSQQIHIPYITTIPLTLIDLLNVTSIPNGQSFDVTHHFNIGKALFETYGLPNDFYFDGLWRSHRTFELCFTGKFTGGNVTHNSEVYNLQTGFRNIHQSNNTEHSSTAYTIDCGYESVQNSSSSFRKSIRYNSGMVYIVGSDELYGSHFLYLKTKLHIQTPLTSTVDLKGVLTVKVY